MTERMRVLVVGGGGRLGAKIVAELRARGADVRIGVRDPGKVPGSVRVDLADDASLAAACEDRDVVVSAVQGLRDVIVDGQTRLARAGERAGVARMVPSDYALDFFKTAPGGNRNLDLRRELNAVLDGTRVAGTSVLCGAFMDLLAMHIGPDPKTGVYRVWGDPDQRYDFTHTDDVARYIAAAALDPAAGRYIRVAGDSLSPRELAHRFAEARGQEVTLEVAGSVADLDAAIAKQQAADPAPNDVFPRWQQMQYTRDMASGRGVLEPLDNTRYPDIQPMTVRAFLARALK